MIETFEQIITTLKKEKERMSSNGLLGIPSGFSKLDKVTNGFQNGQLIILAGRPGIGKTRFVLNIVRNIVTTTDKKIVIFTLDVTAKTITNFILKNNTDNIEEKLVNAPIYIEDDNSISILELMERASALKHKQNIDFIIIDYLQLFPDFEIDTIDNNKKDFEKTVRLLKILAKSLNIPILVLSVLPLKAEERGLPCIPRLNDINEYGNVTRHTDTVLALYNQQYYGIEVDEDGKSTSDQSIIYVQQSRNGLLGEIKLKHNSQTGDFNDLFEEWEEEYNRITGQSNIF